MSGLILTESFDYVVFTIDKKNFFILTLYGGEGDSSDFYALYHSISPRVT